MASDVEYMVCIQRVCWQFCYIFVILIEEFNNWHIFAESERKGSSASGIGFNINNNNKNNNNASLLQPIADFIWITGVGHHIGTFYTFSIHSIYSIQYIQYINKNNKIINVSAVLCSYLYKISETIALTF